MNTKKLDLGIAIVWGISLVLGFMYNTFVLPLATQNSGTEHIMKYVTYLICIVGSTFFLHWFAKKMSAFGTGKMFILMFIPLVLASIVLHYTTGIDEMMAVTFIIGVLCPLFVQSINQYIYQKHGILKTLGLMFLVVIAGYLCGGFNTLALMSIATIITIAASVFVYDVENSKHWYAALVVSAVILTLSFSVISTFDENAKEIMFGYLMPKNNKIYWALYENLKDIQLFKFEPASKFMNIIQYEGSSVYMHLTDMFGIIVSGLLIITQIIGVILMKLRSKFLTNKSSRIFGVMMSLVIGLQILFSLGSSFCRGPINDSGIPFISCKGLELSLVPYLMFILNINADKKCEGKERPLISAKHKQNKKKPLHAYIFEIVGLEDGIEKIEEWRR